MSNSFKVEWEVEDGYVGPSRPQRFKVFADDIFLSSDMNEEDIINELDFLVDIDFKNKISYTVTNQDEFIEWMKERIKEVKEDE